LKELLAAAVVLALSAAAFFLAHQANPSQHFGIGRWDRPFLADENDFYPPSRMEGPIRHADGSVEVKDFVGRLTKKRARFTLPYHALGSPVGVVVRCHRFGLEGTVSLVVNGERIDEFPFVKTSYPWGGIEAVVPQAVAERGPLRIDLMTEGGENPPAHLPQDLGVGVDFVEVKPLEGRALLLPTAGQWLGLFLLLLSGYAFFRFLGWGSRASAFGVLALAASSAAATVFFPTLVSRSLLLAWLAFPACILLLRAAELADRWFPVQPVPKEKHE
jgi:hypothetical protein